MKERYNYKFSVVEGKVLREHREVAKVMLGRDLKPDEVVHHINEVKSDNSPCNLNIISRGEHTKHHRSVCKYETITCDSCGKQFDRPERVVKNRTKNGYSKCFCSKECERNSLYYKELDDLIRAELSNGLSGYAIAKKHNLNRGTVYNHINSDLFKTSASIA